MYRKLLLKLHLSLILFFILSCTTEKTIIQPQGDTEAPTLEWVFPTSADTLTDIVTIQFAAFDNEGVDSVVTYLNGRSPLIWRSAVDDDTLYSFIWNTAETSDGQHILEARAWDFTGNLGISPSLLVRVKNSTDPPPDDISPPVVSWHYPEPGSVVSGEVELMFNALDDVGIDIVKIFINGANPDGYELVGHGEEEYSFLWGTELFADGLYSIEIIVRDMAGNIGSAPAIWLEVLNHPDIQRVIWVPDDYETIQGAIDASEDGDTVRVRAGTYDNGGVRILRKKLWLESEEGPEVTIILGTNRSSGIDVWGAESIVTIRGFTVRAEWNGILSDEGAQMTVYNCIVNESPLINGIIFLSADAKVYNCVIDNVDFGVYWQYVSGCVYNTIVINSNIGFRNVSRFDVWVDYGWNLFWGNDEDHVGNWITPKDTDIYDDPQFFEDSYRLKDVSSAIDAGNPAIKDNDNSRSDMGIYGGPYAY